MDEKEQSNFPLWWLNESKRNMEGLRDIISHLQEKTAAMRHASSGYRGKANEMEGQLIETLTRLEEHISVLSDVVQAALQIIVEEHESKKHKVKRALAWIRAAAHKGERAIAENLFYQVAAIASTAAFLWLLISAFYHAR